MALSFENIWNRVRNELQKGQVIKNWGNARGFSGNTFKIVEINENKVVCKPPNAKNLQIVPKDDFKKVFEIWPKYFLGNYPRYQIRDEVTRYSSYIISIFKYLAI